MVSVLLYGIFFGILLSFLIGPVFFVLLETSIKKGIKAAIFIDIGVLFSDIIYLAAAYFFSQKILFHLSENSFIKYIAAGVFLIMGISSIVKRTSPQKGKSISLDELEETTQVDKIIFRKRTYLSLILKGIGLNAINPGVLIYWIAACTAATEEMNIQEKYLGLYFGATLATMFSVDILKIYFASKLQNKMTPKTMSVMSVIIGIIFIIFGIAMCFKDLHGTTI